MPADDISLNCFDCGRPFTITTSERKFYTSKKMPLPKRCKPCRDERKATINTDREGRRYE